VERHEGVVLWSWIYFQIEVGDGLSLSGVAQLISWAAGLDRAIVFVFNAGK
jgi:hypothetical protein